MKTQTYIKDQVDFVRSSREVHEKLSHEVAMCIAHDWNVKSHDS